MSLSILNPLYFAVAWVLEQVNHGLIFIGLPAAGGLTWVLSIVILVVLMRLILVPLFIKQMHATRKMAALAPQLKELRKKYKNDKETLNAETMRLYRENGANPLAGCLPLVAQMPLFFALFNVLRGISEWNHTKPLPYGLSRATVSNAKGADILGAHISDKVLFTGSALHVPLEAKIVILCTVAISVITTFMTVRQSAKRGMTPQMSPDSPMASSQKIMQYVVPLFALSGLYWQFGLVLYWVTTNVWTLGQQYALFKRYPTPPVAAAAGGATEAGAPAPSSGAAPAKPPRGGAPSRRGGPAAGAKPGAGKSGAPSEAAPRETTAHNGAGAKGANGSGMLRRLTKARSEPEPQQAHAEVKLVRQQRTRQSRSKRSGKR